MMTVRSLLSGATLLAFGAVAAGAFQEWKGMILAAPGLNELTPEQALLRLAGYEECQLRVGRIPPELGGLVTQEDLKDWTETRLKALGIQVFTFAEIQAADKAADKSSDAKALKAMDRFLSVTRIELTAVRTTTGTLCVNVRIGCDRGVFLHPGFFTAAPVWDNSILIECIKGNERNDVWRTVNELFYILEKNWKVCNSSP